MYDEDCANCGHTAKLPLAGAGFTCSECGMSWEPSDEGLPDQPLEWESAPDAPIAWPNAEYVGGHPRFVSSSASGHLYVTSDAISLGSGSTRFITIPLDLIESIEVGGGEVSRRKVGAVLVFGVLGGLAAKSHKYRTVLLVHTTDGETAYFQNDKKDPTRVAAQLRPLLSAVGIHMTNGLVAEVSVETSEERPTGMTQDQRAPQERVRALVGLHREGLVTDEEYEAKRRSILHEL